MVGKSPAISGVVANATSNRIYALGYRPVVAWEEIAFVHGPQAAANLSPS
jgi:hypothetical protein